METERHIECLRTDLLHLHFISHQVGTFDIPKRYKWTLGIRNQILIFLDHKSTQRKIDFIISFDKLLAPKKVIWRCHLFEVAIEFIFVELRISHLFTLPGFQFPEAILYKLVLSCCLAKLLLEREDLMVYVFVFSHGLIHLFQKKKWNY